MAVEQCEDILASPFNQGKGFGALRMQTRQQLAKSLLVPAVADVFGDMTGSSDVISKLNSCGLPSHSP